MSERSNPWNDKYYQNTRSQKHRIICAACRKVVGVGEGVVRHHVSYFPQVRVPVHTTCHRKIHWGTEFERLMPDPRQTIRFYRQAGTVMSPDQRFNLDLSKRCFETEVPRFFNLIEKEVGK